MQINIEQNKKKIIDLLESVAAKRPGIDYLVNFIENKSDFFHAPCSTQFHLSCEGGLAQHSLDVYCLLFEKCSRYADKLDVEKDSIIITGLMHDICKANFYAIEKKWIKINNKWVEKEIYVVKDRLPLGHGEKSVIVIQKYISLHDKEMLAIRWHMGAFEAGIHFNYPSGYAFKEAAKYPLVTLLFTADYEASQIIEAE